MSQHPFRPPPANVDLLGFQSQGRLSIASQLPQHQPHPSSNSGQSTATPHRSLSQNVRYHRHQVLRQHDNHSVLKLLPYMFHAVLCQTADVFNSPSRHHPHASLSTNAHLKTCIPVLRDSFLHGLDVLETDIIRAKTAFHHQLRQIQARNEEHLFEEQVTEQNKQELVDSSRHQPPFLVEKEEKEKITKYDQAKRIVTETPFDQNKLLGKTMKANDIIVSEQTRHAGATVELKRKNDIRDDKVRAEQVRKRQAVTIPATVPTSTTIPFNELHSMTVVTKLENPTISDGDSSMPVFTEPKESTTTGFSSHTLGHTPTAAATIMGMESNPKDPGLFEMKATIFGAPNTSAIQFAPLVAGRSSPLVLPASQPYLTTDNGFFQYPDSVPESVAEDEFGMMATAVQQQQQQQQGNDFDSVDDLFNY